MEYEKGEPPDHPVCHKGTDKLITKDNNESRKKATSNHGKKHQTPTYPSPCLGDEQCQKGNCQAERQPEARRRGHKRRTSRYISGRGHGKRRENEKYCQNTNETQDLNFPRESTTRRQLPGYKLTAGMKSSAQILTEDEKLAAVGLTQDLKEKCSNLFAKYPHMVIKKHNGRLEIEKTTQPLDLRNDAAATSAVFPDCTSDVQYQSQYDNTREGSEPRGSIDIAHFKPYIKGRKNGSNIAVGGSKEPNLAYRQKFENLKLIVEELGHIRSDLLKKASSGHTEIGGQAEPQKRFFEFKERDLPLYTPNITNFRMRNYDEELTKNTNVARKRLIEDVKSFILGGDMSPCELTKNDSDEETPEDSNLFLSENSQKLFEKRHSGKCATIAPNLQKLPFFEQPTEVLRSPRKGEGNQNNFLCKGQHNPKEPVKSSTENLERLRELIADHGKQTETDDQVLVSDRTRKSQWTCTKWPEKINNEAPAPYRCPKWTYEMYSDTGLTGMATTDSCGSNIGSKENYLQQSEFLNPHKANELRQDENYNISAKQGVSMKQEESQPQGNSGASAVTTDGGYRHDDPKKSFENHLKMGPKQNERKKSPCLSLHKDQELFSDCSQRKDKFTSLDTADSGSLQLNCNAAVTHLLGSDRFGKQRPFGFEETFVKRTSNVEQTLAKTTSIITDTLRSAFETIMGSASKEEEEYGKPYDVYISGRQEYEETFLDNKEYEVEIYNPNKKQSPKEFVVGYDRDGKVTNPSYGTHKKMRRRQHMNLKAIKGTPPAHCLQGTEKSKSESSESPISYQFLCDWEPKGQKSPKRKRKEKKRRRTKCSASDSSILEHQDLVPCRKADKSTKVKHKHKHIVPISTDESRDINTLFLSTTPDQREPKIMSLSPEDRKRKSKKSLKKHSSSKPVGDNSSSTLFDENEFRQKEKQDLKTHSRKKRSKKNKDVNVDLPLALSDMSSPPKQSERKEKAAKKTKRHRPSPSKNYMRESEDELAFQSVSSTELSQSILKLYEEIHKLTLQIEASASEASIYTSAFLPDTDENTLDRSAPVDREGLITPYFDEPSSRASTLNRSRNHSPERKKEGTTKSKLTNTTKIFDDDQEETEDTLDEKQEAEQKNTKDEDEEDEEDDDGYFKVSPKTCTICPRNETDKDEDEVKENKMFTNPFLCSEKSNLSKKYESFGFESFNIKSPSSKCFACYNEDLEATGSQKEIIGTGVDLMEHTESEGDRYFSEAPPILPTADTSPPSYHVGLSHNPVVSTFPPEYHPLIIPEPQTNNKESSPAPEYYRDDTMANLSYVKFVSPPKFFSTPVQLKRSYENRSGSPSYDDQPCFACGKDSDDNAAAPEQEQEQWQEQWQEQPEVTTLEQSIFQDPSIIFTSGLAPQSPPQPVTCENTFSHESKKFKGIMTQECSGINDQSLTDHQGESIAAWKEQLNILSNFKTHTRNAPLLQKQSIEKFDMTREKNSSQNQLGKNNYILKIVEHSHSKQDCANKNDQLSKENKAPFLKKNFNDHNQATEEKKLALKHQYSVRSSRQKSSKSEEKLLQRSSPTSGERTTNPKQQCEKEIDLTSQHKNVTLSKKESLKNSSDLQEHTTTFTDHCINNERNHFSKGDTAKVTQHYKMEKDKISQKASQQVRQNHSDTNNPISNKSKSSVTQQYSHGYKSYARGNDEKKLTQESSKENNQVTNNPVSTKSKSSVSQQYAHGYKSYARGNDEKKLKQESSRENNQITNNPVSTKSKSSVIQQYAHGYKSYARGNDAEKLKQENSKENNPALQEKKIKSTQQNSNICNLTSHSTRQKDAMPKFTVGGENNAQLLGQNSKDNNKFSDAEKSKSNQGYSKENGQGFQGLNNSGGTGVKQQSGKESNKISTAENSKETSVFDNSLRVLPTRYMFKSTGPLGDSKIVCTSEAAVPISNNTTMKSNVSSSYKSTPSEHDKNSNGYRGRSQIESPSLHYDASKCKEPEGIASSPTARQGNINSMSHSETVLGPVEREKNSYTSLPTGFAPKPLNAYYEHSENSKLGAGFPRVQNVSCVWDIEDLLTDAEPFKDRPRSNEAELKHRSETTLHSPSPEPTGSTMNCLRDILFGSARALELTSDTKQHACPPKSRSRSARSKKDGDGNVKSQGSTSLQQSSESSDVDDYCIDAYINCRTQKSQTSPRCKHPAGNSNGKSEYRYKHPILNSSERQRDLKLNLNLTSGRDKGAGEMNCENQNYDVELWEKEEAKTLGIKGRNLWPQPQNTSYNYPYKSWDDDAEIASKLVAHYSDAIKSSRRKNRPDCSPRPPFTHCTSPHKIQGGRSINMDDQQSAENVPLGLTHQVYKQTNLDKVGLDAVREPANCENLDQDLRKRQSFEFEPTYQSVGNEKLMSSFEHMMNLKRPCYVQHCGFRRRQQENLNSKPSSNDNNSSSDASPHSDYERPGGKQQVSECRYQPVEEYGSFYKIEEESPFERIAADNYSFCQEDLSDDEERYGENCAEESDEEEKNGNQNKKEFGHANRDKSEGGKSVARNQEMSLDEESVDEDEATDEESGDDDDVDVSGNVNEKDETNFDEPNWQRRADQSWHDYDEVASLSRGSRKYDVILDVSEDDAGTDDEEEEEEEEEEEDDEYIDANCAAVNKSNNCSNNAVESGEVKTVVPPNQNVSQMPESGFREAL